MTQKILYYLNDFTDEVMPSHLQGPSLDGWAVWLSEGGERSEDRECCWTFDPPADGAEYRASALSFDADITAKRGDDTEDGPVVTFDRPVDGYDFVAVRFGPGMGWSAEDILSSNDVVGELAEECCPHIEPGDECLLAVAHERQIVLAYRANPPRLEEVGGLQ